ncbi:uncharacterized protein LOC141658694 [Silene latifolia]|uniref:uncharacterized protein LOC141658694 n=1 Tax=Silene latifolia TaxID=37657 RepID=UPI003D782B12
MKPQEEKRDISPLCDESGHDDVETGSHTRMNQIWSSPKHRPKKRNSCPSILTLPEMTSQPSNSVKLELLSDDLSDEDEDGDDCLTETSIHDFEQELTQGLPIKRSRSAELHNIISKRKRQDRINKKIKVLQDLVPNCEKKDEVSIIENAIDYMKQLRSQVETTEKRLQRLQEGFAHQQTPFSTMTPFSHTRPILGMGMCYCCCIPYAPFFQIQMGRCSFSGSKLARNKLPTFLRGFK